MREGVAEGVSQCGEGERVKGVQVGGRGRACGEGGGDSIVTKHVNV